MFPLVASNYVGVYLIIGRRVPQSKFTHPNACFQIIKDEIGIATTTRSLTHWGRAAHTRVNKLASIGPDNVLSFSQCQADICTNAGILLIESLGTNSSEMLSTIHAASFQKIPLRMSSAKWRQFRNRLDVLIMNNPALKITH